MKDTSGKKLRILEIDSIQFEACVVAAFTNMLALGSKIIAYQNERPGLITLIGYIGLVYGFLIDTLLLGETFGAIELLGVILMLFMNVLLIACGTVKGKNKDKEEFIEPGDNDDDRDDCYQNADALSSGKA